MKLSVPSKGTGLMQSLSVINRANIDTSTANAMWSTLQDAIHKIFQQRSSSLSFEQLYGYAYKLCLSKKGEMLYNGVSDTVRKHLLIELVHVCQAPGEILLSTVKRLWDEFKSTVNNIKDVLMYMDRNFVKQTKRPETRDLAFAIFREVILYDINIRGRFKQLLLENVASERSGMLIDRSLMKSTLFMLVELGAYENEFERDFLQQSKDFYSRESQQVLFQLSSADYMKNAENRILEECDRTTNYLSQSSTVKLLSIVEAELITAHATSLVGSETGCASMFRENRVDDLRRMYALFHRVPGTLDVLRDFMENYVKEVGLAIVRDADNVKNQVRLVQQLLDLRAKFDIFIDKSFAGERKAQRSLKSSFEHFINSDMRCASHLAVYVDDLLKNGGKEKSDIDIDECMNRFIVLFCYFFDKDVFENVYKNLLAKRLLNGKASDELEKMMIVKLKAECGNQFTSKLEGMFTDIQISKGTVMKEFRSSDDYAMLPKVALDVHVLTSGYWPLRIAPMCRVPPEIDGCITAFQDHYLKKYKGRKLTWSSQNGTAELKANFSAGAKDLIVSTYQMCILAMFNDNDTVTLVDILRTLKSSDEAEIKRHLLSLSTPKMRILKKSSKGKGIAADDAFTFNDEFTNKAKRVQVLLISMKEISDSGDGDATSAASTGEGHGTADESLIPSNVDEDRRGVVEACIVRIMKARRAILHNDLVAEVTRQLQNRFNPKPVFIKKRIESLIERDYMARDALDSRVYTYVA